ncbi:hypothetical protein C6503_23940 [Candidatus Poribacteria bacterium]|nr:MAG: hypothetical protein C6503_23940 [Candidatus Poribacteria bacterium]
MSYYAIGIGGTGAKCLESLIHLAAAGMMPDGDLHLLFVDPDASNGSRARVADTLTYYMECKDRLDLGQTNLLKTRIDRADPIPWTPFNDTNPKLKEFFHYDNFRDSPAGKLFDVLYSRLEKECPLDEGFRGHPSIGSAVIAKTVDLAKDATWRAFCDKIKNDDGVTKVFLAASIFGGTGASGFPTIAKILNDDKNLDVTLGGALILPYFKFRDDEDDTDGGDDSDGTDDADDGDDGKLKANLKAKSNQFLMNTQTALKHYHLWNRTGIYNAVYLLGDKFRVDVENAPGGGRQKNAPHFIELYAALAAIDFFQKDIGNDQNAEYRMASRSNTNLLQWTDLPDGENVRSSIGKLARFAFTYLSVYHPALTQIAEHSRDVYRAPWYVHFFERRNIQYASGSLDCVEKYCSDFLRWLANIQGNCSNMLTIELVDYSTYAERKADGTLDLKSPKNFSNDPSHLIQSQRKSNVLSKHWERMCSSGKTGRDAQGIGKFLRALYENC